VQNISLARAPRTPRKDMNDLMIPPPDPERIGQDNRIDMYIV
jgi:hypothetical protein